MAIERIVDTSDHTEDSEEQIIEVTLRPGTFKEYVGQDRLKKNLQLAIEAATKRSPAAQLATHCACCTASTG